MHRRCAWMTSVGRPDARVSVLFLSLSNIFEIRKNNLAKNYPTIREIYILSIFRKYYSDNFAYHI